MLSCIHIILTDMSENQNVGISAYDIFSWWDFVVQYTNI